ncbi:MAG TPA: arginine deiminase-related protein, partial [Chryseosolibacter sp.]|nr:arginine deiminase-related protein [Chryseosolibacter sp.]
MKNTVPHALVMVRPRAFGFNRETADSNVFQQSGATENSRAIHENAVREFDEMVDLLMAHEIDVRVFDDTTAVEKPDAVFPNNWVSFHPDGRVILYPMMAENRRLERRPDIIDVLRNDFAFTEQIDLTGEEKNGVFLEGTGSVVFDHGSRRLFAARSPRTHESLVGKLAALLDYVPVTFDATDERGRAIYHTNVMMSIGRKFAVVCLDAIRADGDQDQILGELAEAGKRVIAISHKQMNAFAGNVIEVESRQGDACVLISRSAYATLLPGQINAMAAHAELLTIGVETIEKYGGGSVRCMVAGVH